MHHYDMPHLLILITYPRSLSAQLNLLLIPVKCVAQTEKCILLMSVVTAEIMLMSVVIKDNKITDK